MNDLKMLGSNILLKPIKPESVEKIGSLIVIAGRENFEKGSVVSVGKGRTESGVTIPPAVKEGDIVVYHDRQGAEIRRDGETYIIIQEKHLMAVLEDDQDTGS